MYFTILVLFSSFFIIKNINFDCHFDTHVDDIQRRELENDYVAQSCKELLLLLN